MEKNKNKRNIKPAIIILGIVIALSIIVTALGSWDTIYGLAGLKDNIKDDSSCTVKFFDVGCADSCLLICGEKSLLIDCGNKVGNQNLLHYLQQNQVKKLDMVIITHFDSDHCNNYLEISSKIPIEYLVTSFPFKGSDSGRHIVSAAMKNGTKVEYKGAGDILNLGHMNINVLSPHEQYKSDNDNSLVVMVKVLEKSLLFMGDASENVEQNILSHSFTSDLQCNILKVSHHGANKSTNEDFLSSSNPDYAIVSVGPNSYGLPSYQTISRLLSNGSRVLRTDESGCVTFKITKDNININTEY